MLRRFPFRAVFAVLSSLVLVGTLVTPVQAAEVVPPALDGSQSFPALPSPEVVVPLPTVPEGDFEDTNLVSVPAVKGVGGVRPDAPNSGLPDGAGSSFDEDVSVLETQTEFTNAFVNDDGTKTLEVGKDPLNAKDDSGAWVPVETFVTRDSEGWSTDAHPLDPSFAPNADDEGAFSVSRGGYDISFTLDEAASSDFSRVYYPRQQTTGDEIVYNDVFENVDLTYEIQDGGVKESLILDALPAYEDSHWVWRVEANALSLSVDEHGVINFTDRYGKVQFHIPAPIMWDSSGVAGVSEPATANVATRVW